MHKRYREWWPTAKYVHVVRDPRDVYASYKARDEKNNRPVTAIDAFAFAWGRSVLQLKENLGDVGESNYLVIKYEDVVSNPDKMMASILAFLDLDPHEITATPTKGHGRVPWGGNPESGKKEFKVYSSALREVEIAVEPERGERD